MQVILTPLPVPILPIPAQTQEISIDGKKIGIVKLITDSDNYNYHVVLNSKRGYSVYQGFGTTVDEALRNAVVIGKEHRVEEIQELDNLENVIWGDHELNKQ